MMLKRKTAEKVQKHFAKLIDKINEANENAIIVLNIGRAESFIKALELVEAIDYYTAEKMKSATYEAEQDVYKRKNIPLDKTERETPKEI